MTKKEFTTRTLVEVSDLEYMCIEDVYMNSDLNKDEFCKIWCKMNASRVQMAKDKKAEEERKQILRHTMWSIVNYGYTQAEFEADACDILNIDQREACRKVGIDLFDYSYPKFTKSVSRICYEVKQYLSR